MRVKYELAESLGVALRVPSDDIDISAVVPSSADGTGGGLRNSRDGKVPETQHLPSLPETQHLPSLPETQYLPSLPKTQFVAAAPTYRRLSAISPPPSGTIRRGAARCRSRRTRWLCATSRSRSTPRTR
jgi:hypothetical protein